MFRKSHDICWVPEDRVGVEIFCRIKPEMELLLFVPLALCKHIGVNCDRIRTQIPKKLEVDLIMILPS